MQRIQPSPGSSADTLVRLRGDSRDSGAWDCFLLDPHPVRRRSRSGTSGADYAPTSRFSTLSEPPSLRLSALPLTPSSSPNTRRTLSASRTVGDRLGALDTAVTIRRKKSPETKQQVTRVGFCRRLALCCKEACLKTVIHSSPYRMSTPKYFYRTPIFS
ncbi:hypothetical protein SK128_013199 [Halocaridina rubra]|uniref:Uncharacterized protein n=1 Tax=Halocaridina rubra TaxID=373956 RepID=A0AAN9AD55_HALRR